MSSRPQRAAATKANGKITDSIINDENNNNVNSPPPKAVKKRKSSATQRSTTSKAARGGKKGGGKKRGGEKGGGKKGDNDNDGDDNYNSSDESALPENKKSRANYCSWSGWICYKCTGGGKILSEEEAAEEDAMLDAWMKGGK